MPRPGLWKTRIDQSAGFVLRSAGQARLAGHHGGRGEAVGLAADLDDLERLERGGVVAHDAVAQRGGDINGAAVRGDEQADGEDAAPAICANGRCSAPGASGTSTLRRPVSRRLATSSATSSLDPAQVTNAVRPSGVSAMRIGTPANGSRAVTSSDAVSTTARWPSARAATQSSRPSGVTASASDPAPVSRSPSLRPAARSSAVVVPEPMLVT